MEKKKDFTQFAYYLRNSKTPTILQVTFGEMEKRDTLNQKEYQELRRINRMKYCVINQEARSIVKPMEVEIEGVSKHEMV